MSDKFRNKYRIGSNRAQFWNYSEQGFYFITVCIEDRERILGVVKNGKMLYLPYGQIVADEIEKLSEYDQRVILDEWVVMPNHIHLIIELREYGYDNGISVIGDNDGRNDTKRRNGNDNDVEKIHEFSLRHSIDDIKKYRKKRRKMLIPKILGKLKQQTSKQINILRNTPGRKNWQKDYYDHIIRNNQSYENIKRYIINNPKNWEEDKFKDK